MDGMDGMDTVDTVDTVDAMDGVPVPLSFSASLRLALKYLRYKMSMQSP